MKATANFKQKKFLKLIQLNLIKITEKNHSPLLKKRRKKVKLLLYNWKIMQLLNITVEKFLLRFFLYHKFSK